MSLTEAVQQPAGQTASHNSFGCEVKSSGFMNMGSLSNRHSRWGQHIIAQLTPKENIAPLNLELGSRRLNSNLSLTGTHGAVVCTKRIGAHLLASRAGSPDRSADGWPVSRLNPHSGEQVPRAEPPYLAAVSEVATQMSTIQLEKEEKWTQAVLPGKPEYVEPGGGRLQCSGLDVAFVCGGGGCTVHYRGGRKDDLGLHP